MDRAELTGSEGIRRPVALKRMLPHVAENEDMIEAFVREARLARHLRHANVAQTYEFGQVDDAYFIAMELVTGPTLREILKRCGQASGPMPIPIALNLLNQICDALDYAHNLRDELGQPLGIIHRDVSPSNIIVNQAGVAKLIDFGVAKASAAGMQTTSGMIKGKFAYMAPEYLIGGIDARADLFAVGVIAHELLTNRPLFSGANDMETLQRVRAMRVQPPSRGNPNVPPEIDDIVMTALSREPDHRWQHATALRTALTTVTRRLGLVCTNRQVVDWLATTKPSPGATGTHEDDLSYLSLQIEEPMEPELPVLQRAPTPPPRTPIATPVRSIAAQASSPTPAPHAVDHKEHRAAVPAYGRHEGLLPSPRNTDDVRTARLRPPPPRIDPSALRPASSDDALDETTEVHALDDALGDATELHPTDDALALNDATELYPPDDALDTTELHPPDEALALGDAMRPSPAPRTKPAG